MKKIAALLVPLILIGMFSFGTAAKTRTINVYNWGEYIPDGSDGSLNINELFTEKTGIEVNYVTFASNEEMYAKLASGGVSYDVVIPSDYMIERMIKENMLQKLDFDNIPNYQYIVDRYKSLAYDPDNAYSVPYTVGLVGIIYNTTVVTETPASWDLLWNEKYSDQILMFDNSRDAFAAAQFLLGYDVNTTDVNELNAVAQKLKEQKSLVRKYVM
ncbi:MAG TPA: spermidine/putrescine ABC transporter substrate-binding protein, partial [Bacillota bacterium]|nr:spermidine/putrescine ABC transporter substrate-binding protein [Bacillota bacterium]